VAGVAAAHRASRRARAAAGAGGRRRGAGAGRARARRARPLAGAPARGPRPGVLSRPHRGRRRGRNGCVRRQRAPALLSGQTPPRGASAMTDDEIRDALRAAHAGDDPPPFDNIVDRAPPRRSVRWLVAVAVGVACTAAVVWLASPRRGGGVGPAPAPTA